MTLRFARHLEIIRWWSRIITHPERVFLLMAAPIGMAYLLLTPPFNSPDEPNHFYRAWHISTGHPMALKGENRIGGVLPVSLRELSQHYEPIIWREDNAGITKQLFAEAKNIKLNPDHQRFYDFNNTAAYPTLCYLPHAAGILTGRALNLEPLYIFYLARLFAFVTWLTCLYFAIRTMPIMKWLFAALALLPMSAYINMSVSADVVTSSVCMLFIATAVRSALAEGLILRRELYKLAVLAALLATVKMPYVPLVVLVFIIPRSRFNSTAAWLGMVAGVFTCAAAVSVFWYLWINSLYIAPEFYNPDHGPEACLPGGIDVHKQATWLFSSVDVFTNVLKKSLGSCAENHFDSFIAAYGWTETTFPKLLVILSYIMLLSIAVLDGGTLRVNWLQRLIFCLCVLLVFSAVVLSLYLSWHGISAPMVRRLPGRYLIPFYPLVFLLLYTRLKKQSAAAMLAVALSLGLNIYGIVGLFNRYYFLPG